jgi:hypothetical protein
MGFAMSRWTILVQMKPVCAKFVNRHNVRVGAVTILAIELNAFRIARRWTSFALWPSLSCKALVAEKAVYGLNIFVCSEIWLMPQTLEGKPGNVFRHDSAPSPIHSYNTMFTQAFGCSLEPPRGPPSDCCVAWICHCVKWFSKYEHVSLFLLKCQV